MTEKRPLLPTGMSAPLARYSHGMEIAPGARYAFVSGQLGILPDGSVPFGVEAQAAACFENVARILADAGMSLSDLVRINAYVTDRDYLAGYMRVRDRYAGTPPPASTLMIVSGFARVEFVVEVEAVAAKPAGSS